MPSKMKTEVEESELADSAAAAVEEVVQPVVRGFVKDWDAMEDLLTYVLYSWRCSWEMGDEGQILFTEPPLLCIGRIPRRGRREGGVPVKLHADDGFQRMDQMMMTEEGRRELSEYSPANNANTNSTVKDMLLGCACVNMKRRPGPADVGSTACVALIRGNQIIVGNAGDCRCVVGTKVFEMVFLLVHEEEEVKPLICPPRKRKREVFDLPRGSSRLKKLENGNASSL